MNVDRVQLYEKLPLEVPFSVHIFPSFYCNFKCNYCLHSLDKVELAHKGFQKQFMTLPVYKKVIDDMLCFPQRVKALIFAGHGEPLMHGDIVEMVSYAKKSKMFERVEMVTNASLLTPELSDGLIAAGLDRIRISLQGICAADYKEVSGVDINFDDYVNNIRYFYNHKISTEVYIKIIDVALKHEKDKKIFEELFKEIADITAIEYAIPFVKEIDYTKVGELSDKCKQGHKQISHICSMPFYMMVINPNGDVVPCCSTEIPMVFGNVNEENLYNIWQSQVRRAFLKRQLGGITEIPICKECSVPIYGLQKGDYLDGHEKELLRRY